MGFAPSLFTLMVAPPLPHEYLPSEEEIMSPMLVSTSRFSCLGVIFVGTWQISVGQLLVKWMSSHHAEPRRSGRPSGVRVPLRDFSTSSSEYNISPPPTSASPHSLLS